MKLSSSDECSLLDDSEPSSVGETVGEARSTSENRLLKLSSLEENEESSVMVSKDSPRPARVVL